MKNKNQEASYYKNRIQGFLRYSKEELYDFFKSTKMGVIVMSYPSFLEKSVYEDIALLLKAKYPEYCDKEEIVKILSSYGNIYTAKINEKMGSGIYHKTSANILIYSFLNKLNESIVHELIHKLGYLRFNEDFYNMPLVLLEPGTELVTNTILNKPVYQELLFGSLWTRSVGVDSNYLIETALVNQLNMACGNNTLEKSIINGRNYIEPEAEKLIGKEKYLVFQTQIQDISRLEKQYWRNPKNSRLEKDLSSRIFKYQNDLLTEVFDARINNVTTKEEAEAFLQELMNFSDYRVKSEDLNFEDIFFTKYFNAKKKELEEKFKFSAEIEDLSKSWRKRYPIINLDEEILEKSKLEKIKIDEMAEKRFQNEPKGFFRKLFSKKQKPELPNTSRELETKDFKIDTTKLNRIENKVKTKNKEDLEKWLK